MEPKTQEWVITPDLFLPGNINTDAIICVICGQIMTNPAMLMNSHNCCMVCEHMFCLDCIRNVYTQDCPVCRRQFNVSTPSTALKKLISNQLMKCVNKECKEIFSIRDMQKHQTLCILETETCGECNISYVRKERTEHTKICEFRFVDCQYCQKAVKLFLLPKHHLMCVSYPLNCVRDGCKYTAPRQTMHMHDVYCQYKVISCPLMCSDKIIRKDLQTHMSVCVNRKTTCSKCKQEMPHCKLSNHPKICPDEMLSCLCGNTFKRKEKALHNALCGFVKVPCVYFGMCCYDFVIRSEMGEHIKNNRKSHQNLMLQKIEIMTRTSSKLDYLDDDGVWKIISMGSTKASLTSELGKCKFVGNMFNPPDENREIIMYFPEMINRLAKFGTNTLCQHNSVNVKNMGLGTLQKANIIESNEHEIRVAYYINEATSYERLSLQYDAQRIENFVSEETSVVLYNRETSEDLVHKELVKLNIDGMKMYKQLGAPDVIPFFNPRGDIFATRYRNDFFEEDKPKKKVDIFKWKPRQDDNDIWYHYRPRALVGNNLGNLEQVIGRVQRIDRVL